MSMNGVPPPAASARLPVGGAFPIGAAGFIEVHVHVDQRRAGWSNPWHRFRDWPPGKPRRDRGDIFPFDGDIGLHQCSEAKRRFRRGCTRSCILCLQFFDEAHACFESRRHIAGKNRFVGMMADAAGAAQKQHGGRECAGARIIASCPAPLVSNGRPEPASASICVSSCVHADRGLIRAVLLSQPRCLVPHRFVRAGEQFRNRVLACRVIGMTHIQTRPDLARNHISCVRAKQ